MRAFGAALLLLTLAVRVEAQTCQYQNIACGNRVSQRLENSGCRFGGSSKPFYGYTFNAFAGQVLDIFLESDAFPPLLTLYEPGNSNAVAFDRGLTITRVRYDVPRSGTYLIAAAADNAARDGLFTLSVYCETVCKAPFFTGGSTSVTIPFGSQTTIGANVDGTPPLTYRWFDNSNPSGTISTSAPPFTTPPLFATTVFGLQVTNACGSATRNSIAVVTVTPCTAPAITQEPADVFVRTGEFVTLETKATGTSLTYQWYRGIPPDTSRPVPYLGTGEAAFTLIAAGGLNGPYWVRVSNSCGTVDSRAAFVNIEVPRRRAVRK